MVYDPRVFLLNKGIEVSKIKLYWCRGSGRKNPNQQNFGDYLSAEVVEFASGKKIVWAPVKSADMIAIGSVLGRESKAKFLCFPRKLHIWGTGTGVAEERFSGRHHYHAVRGQLCADRIHDTRVPPVLGDPGLLSPAIVKKPSRKSARIGIIPHIHDRTSPVIQDLRRRLSGSRVIDVFSPVKQVLAEIASCDFILSTSLHGLIVADSYGVPNKWMVMERNPHWEFKFQDYYSSFGIAGTEPVTPKQILKNASWTIEGSIGNYHRPGLEAMQENLLHVFPKSL
ncbi:hypothetical protein BGP84_18750 [Pseudomonas putida]|jgi:hypothetical protein|uniref:Polysaccharide pyruvyl transferase domain-containing protein n=2 Tax=Pseudomonas TaxID=286 RepID=A0A2S3WYX7_PSEPU|nr:polysaccharide pyruvyl transferase family protein [Pseudomonas putida]POG06505.1 hypothetical protein BGP84_18750 [Pseudomonas putida]POG09248.1 hypothetical protein BGP85_12790 [Pseudomonas putida]